VRGSLQPSPWLSAWDLSSAQLGDDEHQEARRAERRQPEGAMSVDGQESRT